MGGWRIERNDRRAAFIPGDHATVYAESAPAAVARHVHPAWKVVLPVGGTVSVAAGAGRPWHAPGALVPPGVAHTCATSSGFVALFVDAWRLPPASGPLPLDEGAALRLLRALGTASPEVAETADTGAAWRELAAVAGRPPRIDPRAAHALAACGTAARIADLAEETGLSAVRLRALVRAAAGVPLARVRRWHRLRGAVAALGGMRVAEASAAAGFADQAHLARTARAMLGRTAASLRPSA